jgi:SAM-dependent methyltransferase
MKANVVISDLLPPSLHRDESGVWHGASRSEVSYPDDGAASYLDVEERSFWCRHRNQCIIAAMGRFPPPGPILDLGAGNGFVSRGIQDAGFEVVAIEANIVGALAARERGLEHVICGTFQDVDFVPGTVPAAGLFDVLEHIADDVGALSHIHTLLLPLGRIYLTVPAYNLLYSGEDRMLGHFRRYSANSLKRVLTQAGFFVEYTSYLFMPLPAPIFVARTVPSWFGGLQERTPNDSAKAHDLGGPAGSIIDRIFGWEAQTIRRGGRVAVGASCLAVAQKR